MHVYISSLILKPYNIIILLGPQKLLIGRNYNDHDIALMNNNTTNYTCMAVRTEKFLGLVD